MNRFPSPAANPAPGSPGSLLCPNTSAVGAATPSDGILRGAGGLVAAGKPLGGGRSDFRRQTASAKH